MAVRNASAHTITAWKGLNTFISRNNIDEQAWIDSNNVLVNGKGEAEVLRSPKAFGNNLVFESGDSLESSPFSSEPQLIQSMAEFKRVAGNALIIDRGDEVVYLLAAAGEPVLIRAGQPMDTSWTSLSINDTLQRINGIEFIQILNDLTSVYRNGITAPIQPPIIAYAANASDTTVIATGLTLSYAYMNSTTGHVSAPSPLSNTLAAKAAGFDVTVLVQASTQTGVDKIVFFMTVDGGNIPYLVINCNDGSTFLKVNANATYSIVQSDVTRDTLTPEPIYNDPPPTDATFMFGYKDRIFLIVDGGLRYSGFESCYIGNDYESWPALNQLNVPNRSDKAVGGISTQAGGLIFGELDCYLMTGLPSDKVSSPNNVIAVTEHIQPLNWNIGITYPETAVNTPFGVIWTDNTKRIRIWNQTGFPQEAGEPLRAELDAMTDTLTAQWFQHGKNGGYYVLTDGATVLFMMLFNTGGLAQNLLNGLPQFGQLSVGYGKSTSLVPDSICTATFAGVERFFFTVDDQTWEILDPTQEGDGWDDGTEIFFKTIVGNDKKMNFSGLHSMQISGDLEDLVITHAPSSEVNPEEIELTDDLEADTGGAFFGLIDSVERRSHVLAFTWGIDDTNHRGIDSFTLNVQNRRRTI